MEKLFPPDFFFEIDSNLTILQTIKVPKNLLYLTDRLPKPNYDKEERSRREKEEKFRRRTHEGSNSMLPEVQHPLSAVRLPNKLKSSTRKVGNGAPPEAANDEPVKPLISHESKQSLLKQSLKKVQSKAIITSPGSQASIKIDDENEYQDDFEPDTKTPIQKPIKKGKPGPPPEMQIKNVDKK